MKVDVLLKNQGAWLGSGAGTDIVISSRVRLARNCRDAFFPGWADEGQCLEIWNKLEAILVELSGMQPSLSFNMNELSDLDKLVLFERHLISKEHIAAKPGRGLVLRQDERAAVMVNEEDHLRLQALRPGLMLKDAWRCVDEMDSDIEKIVPFAFSERLGYLTACPTNVGTGMRASVMLHLPGLVLMNEIGPVIKGMNKIGLTVRGLWGEGSEAVGNMFQVSNQVTLGDAEEDLVNNLELIVEELVEHEKNARTRLIQEKRSMIMDHIGRAFGILTNAHVLTSKEALALLSSLRLGIELSILPEINRELVDDLLVTTQPAHLQKLQKADMNPQERDEIRAELVRTGLARGK